MATLALSDYLGIHPRVNDSSNVGGSSFMFHLAHAQAAIEAGMCEVAVIAYGSTQKSVGPRGLPAPEYVPHETPFKPLAPISSYALAASRHMYEYGTTREQLAEVAVAARRWATLNPAAFDRAPLSVEDVLASRMVSSPLTVRDCCLFTDGGGALIVTSAARAATLRRKQVYVLAFAMAGLAPQDIDAAELYDAFTINTVLFLEDLGFCPKGDGGPYVTKGAIAPGGVLPVNTNGGGLSFGHPGMYGIFLLIEAVRQLRGECGDRQVEDCEVALAHGNGGVLSTQATVILGSDATV
jgi:acetyl-CoA acetyltransferase